MKMYNHEIYNRTIALIGAFEGNESQKLPIKLSYAIKKNTATLKAIAEGIEKSRMELVEKYAITDEEGNKLIPAEKADEANAEYSDFMNMEEEVNVHTIKISSLSDSIELTDAQMEAIMWMLEDE